ncbi:hypothetical protein MBLNU457_3241t1 [Dothideomycetes sp. NU457]
MDHDEVENPTSYAKCADPDLQEDVDVMILDHLAFEATNVLLEECEERRNGRQDRTRGDDHVRVVDLFLQTFNAQHPTHHKSDELAFRLHLLRFTNMFVRRLERDSTTPSQEQLQALRRRNTERARRWYKGQPHRQPHEPEILRQTDLDQSSSYKDWQMTMFRSTYGQDEPADQVNELSDPRDLLVLMDLLPAFMTLSAVIGAGNKPSTKWMVLAAEFMLQAAYETRMTRTHGFAAVEEAFAWGCYSSEAELPDEEGIDEEYERVDAMFRNVETDAEYVDWDSIRLMHLEELLPRSTGTIFDFHAFESSHDYTKFEQDLCEYLERLSWSSPLPIIAQLTLGQLDGFSKQEIQTFKQRVGVRAHLE